MSEIIRVNHDGEQLTVSARELHKKLEVKYDFTRWIKSNFKEFAENEDFFAGHIDVRGNQYGGTQTVDDYNVTVDMAKHLCLMSKTEKGKQCRQYLIDLEKAWNSPEQVMARALKVEDRIIDKLKNQTLELENTIQGMINVISELTPKANYVDIILKSPSTVLTTQIAQDYGLSAIAFNRKLSELRIQRRVGRQWILYADYQGKGYVHSKTIDIVRSNGQPDVKMQTEWTQKGRLFLYEKLKGYGIYPMIEQAGDENEKKLH